jgi:hypothetical protein
MDTEDLCKELQGMYVSITKTMDLGESKEFIPLGPDR